MSELTFPLRAVAHVAVTVQPADRIVSGFRRDGEPIIRLKHREVMPGEMFEIPDERAFKMLVPEGFASLIDELGNEIEGDK